MIKTAVVGASGFVGRHLWTAYRTAFPEAIGTTFSAADPRLVPFDIRQPDLAALRLEEQGYGAVLISSAKPNVAFCEQHPQESRAVNVTGTLELLRQIGRTSLQAIFISSDYVFDGTAAPYDDGAPTGPTTEYGRQKAEVERQIATLAENHLVLRLSKTFGLAKGDRTLLDDMACTLAAGRPVQAATDQRFSPTWIDDAVRAILAVQERGLRGVVNLCSPETASRYDIASGLARELGIDQDLVQAVRLHDIPSMTGRPLDTRLTPARLLLETGVRFTPLEECLRRSAEYWRS